MQQQVAVAECSSKYSSSRWVSPLTVVGVQMVGGLIQQQDVSLLEHGACQGQFHLPATGDGANLRWGSGTAHVRTPAES